MKKTMRVSAKQEEPNLWQEYKRQSIQAAVIRLMCREGLDAVTMDRVAHEVGIAKGTVYLHYKDKQDLLDAVKESAIDPLTAKLEEIVASSLAPSRKLESYALRYLSYFDENRDLFRILLYEREVPRAHGGRFRSSRYKRSVERVAGVIDEGVAEGMFRDDVDSEKAAAMFIESAIALVNHRLLAAERDPVEADADVLAQLFLRGLAAESPKARKTTK
jgi:AcrR family transcriptional regulator